MSAYGGRLKRALDFRPGRGVAGISGRGGSGGGRDTGIAAFFLLTFLLPEIFAFENLIATPHSRFRGAGMVS